MQQETSLDNYNLGYVKDCIIQLKEEKETLFKSKLNDILTKVDGKLLRALQLAQEKGSGSWLVALPIQSLGYLLNKQ